MMRWTGTGRPGLAIAVGLAAVLAGPGVGPLRAQGQTPLPDLLAADYLLSVGEIVDPGSWRDAETVVGTAGGAILVDHSHTVFDLLYVPAVVEGRSLTPGDQVQTFRLVRPIDDPATGERLGSLLLPTGVARVEDIDGEIARVRITAAFEPVLVGDRVRIAGGGEEAWSRGAASGSGAGRIVAFQEEKAVHPTFDTLFLRSEVAGAFAPGEVVELYRPGEVRDGTRLPDRVLGKAMVVRVEGPLAAAVTFELVGPELEPGDLYRSPRME